MVAAARKVDGIEVLHTDLRKWAPDRPIDVLVSNATLQWVPDHLDLLPTLVEAVAAGGWFAFQVPATSPSRRTYCCTGSPIRRDGATASAANASPGRPRTSRTNT